MDSFGPVFDVWTDLLLRKCCACFHACLLTWKSSISLTKSSFSMRIHRFRWFLSPFEPFLWDNMAFQLRKQGLGVRFEFSLIEKSDLNYKRGLWRDFSRNFTATFQVYPLYAFWKQYFSQSSRRVLDFWDLSERTSMPLHFSAHQSFKKLSSCWRFVVELLSMFSMVWYAFYICFSMTRSWSSFMQVVEVLLRSCWVVVVFHVVRFHRFRALTRLLYSL